MIEDMPGGSKARAKGTKTEVEFLPLLRDLFGEHVNRAPLQGFNDRGDYVGVPWLHEAKAHLIPKFQEWARICEKKAGNRWVIMWHGDRRKGAGHGPYVMMPLDQYERLVRNFRPIAGLRSDA